MKILSMLLKINSDNSNDKNNLLKTLNRKGLMLVIQMYNNISMFKKPSQNVGPLCPLWKIVGELDRFLVLFS